MNHDTDNAGSRRSQACSTSVVDIADGARIFLDALSRIIGNERAVTER